MDYEDMQHLFFSCSFSNEVWRKVKDVAGISGQSNSLQDIVQQMIIMGNGNNINSVVRRLMLAACVYNLWKERNGRIFRDCRRNCEEVINGITGTVKNRLMGITVRDSKDVRAVESKWEVTLKRAKPGK
ncbi:zf-RVT domain-containing protein [Artemisia annua]|uniref:Zf-RVT domain-containing protein n=1 Tax=Artemisia annua TaxID=35608 RepID=A0A2U1PKF3_ARTAN|nr:zf-RVT domain-containing protein [Artemisia annua]